MDELQRVKNLFENDPDLSTILQYKLWNLTLRLVFFDNVT